MHTNHDSTQPCDFGFSQVEFPYYRCHPVTNEPVQWEAIEFAVDCDKRFAAMCVSTGVGKSLIAMTIAKFTGLRTCILTGTKGLQDQYVSQFGKYGLVEIKGRNNYQCVEYANLDCRAGSTMKCACTGGKGCEYERARDRAKNSQIVIANYAYWMTVNDKANGLQRSEREADLYGDNPIECLILDECHCSDGWLEGYLTTKLYEKDIEKWADKKIGVDAGEWRDIAKIAVMDLEVEIENEKQRILEKSNKVRSRSHISNEDLKRMYALEGLLSKYKKVAEVDNDWVIDKHVGTRYGTIWSFDVIWPGRYAEKYLFCGVPKVVMMSGTVKPKTMGLLGVSKEKFKFREWGRVFPANRNPIYNVPAVKSDGNGGFTEIRIDYRTKEGDLEIWLEHIDKIIDGRLDRKGLIQAVSYDRAMYIMNNSRHKELMIGNTADPESESAREIADKFRQSKAPCILVSPSFSTGWDFPGKDCEFIIIAKVPFKPSVSKAMKAREANDNTYGAYLAMQEMVQSAGRGMRHDRDRCEVVIVDGHVSWFLYKYQSMAPAWFVKSVRKLGMGQIPKAPEKL